MDAQEVIRCLNASEECVDSDGTLIAEAQTYLRLFPAVICQYASRNCNNVVHCQAKRACYFQTTSKRRVKKLQAIPQNFNQIIPNNKKAVDDSNKRSSRGLLQQSSWKPVTETVSKKERKETR
ncbi:hypothetical protein Pyn_18516 [Prunus yedoensis var. nudiflora]|uniref:Uncharacterized protein n=1 Tax=Prunus yedoensis var. nudiflora TaxID=2094558 RepID=A0A314UW23_PRUYE|nr:hypothetical protein Pyn_18516 [Prunus yedoensis var. nudiflora]